MPFRSTSSDGSHESHVQERRKALAAGERLRIGAAFLEQLERVIEALGAPVLERRRLHRALLPDPRGRQRQRDGLDPERIRHGCRERRRNAHRVPLPEALGAEQRERRRGAPVPDPERRHIGSAEAEVVDEGAREQVAVLVVVHALQQRCAGAVREAAADLPVDEQRVQQPPRVVNGHVVEDVDHPGLAIDLDDGDVDDEAVSGR